MKKEGKKVGLMPKSDKESKAEDKGEGSESADTTKKTGTFAGKPNKLGGGGRFAQMEAKGASPGLAAYIGQKLYGKKKMASMAAKGKSAK